MNKKIKYSLWIVLAIILLVLIFLVVLANNNETMKFFGNKNASDNSKNLNSEQKNPASDLQNNNSGQATITRPPVVTSMPVYTKEVALEFMTEAEKKALGMASDMKVQVLERDASGKIIAYKIIRQDSDIMTKYGK